MSQNEVPTTDLDHAQTKRHAQLRHAPRATPFWVGNPADWEIVRRRPRPPLVCPEPGCDLELITYENHNNRLNPRIFKFKKGTKPCGHWNVDGQGGGPESLQHQWLKSHLVEIASRHGYTATPEHYPTRADVYVEEPAYCLEVQLVPTNFAQRTKARTDQGTQVCWLVRDGLDTPKARADVFQGPAVRFRVVEAADRGRPAAPWNAPEGEADPVHVQVFATVAHAPRASEPVTVRYGRREWFTRHPMDLEVFLVEILSGRRRWHRPGTVHPNQGYWILDTDLARFHDYQQKQKAVPPVMAREIPKSGPDTIPLAGSPPLMAGASPLTSQEAPPMEIPPEPERLPMPTVSELLAVTPEHESAPRPAPGHTSGPTRQQRRWLAWLKWLS